jgi:ABC-2 type transport system ATP-binding protein
MRAGLARRAASRQLCGFAAAALRFRCTERALPAPSGPMDAVSEPALRADRLTKVYKTATAVNGISFALPRGSITGLLGGNGAGKTTTIAMVCGLLRRDGGEVTVAGASLDQDPAAVKAAIGYVPQDIALYPDLSGGENLRFWGRMQGLAGRELADRVDAVLQVVGLADRARDKVADYSGGMQRRLNIAAGLLHHPRLLVLDEPTVGVDPQSRNAILENVEALRGEGTAVLYTTHYMEEAERLCDRVGIIDQGRLIAEGSRRELVARVGERDRIELAASGDLARLAEAAARLDGVDEATVAAGGVHLVGRDGRRLLPRLFEAAEGTGAEVTSAEVVEPDLEAVFLHLTGKALRD